MNLKRRQLLVATAALPVGVACAATQTQAASHLACPSGTLLGSAPAGLHFIANSFPAMQHIAARAEACTRAGLRVVFKLTPQARTETEQAFASAGRSPFDAALVSMAVFSNLYARRQLQPLTDLVNKHGARWRLEEKMLVRVDGEVMAIAFLQNTQNLYYRADLLSQHGLAMPTDYTQLVQTAAVLKQREPSLSFPIAQGFAKGFDIATEFTNLLASLGGRYFQPGTALPAFNSPAGVQAVALMRSMLPYMTPNVLASNADDVVNQFQQGKAAMGVLWASRASRMDDAAASRVVGQMQFAAAPAAVAGGRSAAHLWWDAAVLPRNHPQQRDLAFQVLMESLSEESVKSGNSLGIWVRSVYEPGRFGVGVVAAQKAGAPVWPSEPFFSLAHAEVGKGLPDALAGERAPQAVLDAAAAAYLRVATEKGFVSAGAGTGFRS